MCVLWRVRSEKSLVFGRVEGAVTVPDELRKKHVVGVFKRLQ